MGNDEAMQTARKLSRLEGLFVGISSGASVAACLKYIERHKSSSKKIRIVTLFPSNGERYLSTELFKDLS